MYDDKRKVTRLNIYYFVTARGMTKWRKQCNLERNSL
jgi:hypothetical protein